jgi:formylglycine-generating enzyme required for sulfatase activity
MRTRALACLGILVAAGCGSREPSTTPDAGPAAAVVSASAQPAEPAGSVSGTPAAAAPVAAPGKPCDGKCFDIERCEAGVCVPACPEGQTYVPPTPPEGFKMGKGLSTYGYGPRKSGNAGKGLADAPHKVVLTKPFCMDRTEVTAGAMKKCVEEKGCAAPQRTDTWVTYPNKPDHPVNLVDWPMAKFYCEQYEQSLPTEAQWEWAATGGDGRTWPWGEEEPTCEHMDFTKSILVSPGGDSGCHGGGPSKVQTHLKGDRIWPAGPIHDLAGNVWEWVIDSYIPYSGKDEVDPVHERSNIGTRVLRGGGWNRSGRGCMAAFRGGAIKTYKVPGLGFRCVRNAKAPAP